jgi:hypothetical protein
MTHPQGILPDPTSVVVIGIKYPDAAIDRWGKLPAESMFFYQSVQLYKNKLAVAGTKAMNRTKRINQGLPASFLIYSSN